eukprot:scaffold125705_cov51-Phaeocystis_antarctica.AAC.1
MFVTLDVSKLSGWLNADAPCRESQGGHTVRGKGAGQQTGATASSVQGRARLQIGDKARGGAHEEHLVHGRDTGGVPVGNVRIEILQADEEVAHVGDGRDVPVGDGAVRCNGGGRVPGGGGGGLGDGRAGGGGEGDGGEGLGGGGDGDGGEGDGG